jgi:REP element-mobilizing transposase RayT
MHAPWSADGSSASDGRMLRSRKISVVLTMFSNMDQPLDYEKTVNRGWHSRGYLPHFDATGALQTIVFRLNDSLPAAKLQQMRTSLTGKLKTEHQVELYKRIERWIDAGYGACHLREPRIASIVQDNLLHFDPAHYKLLEWVIMPNHVHVLIETGLSSSLTTIVKAWKSYTAKRATAVLVRTGTFWAADYFDRFVRGEAHYLNVVRYIRENPVKAGLCARPEDWRFSSARYRRTSAPGM